jgi:hypothetical protein
MPSPFPGADMLILAGDIGSYQQGSRLTDTDFGLGRFSPRNGWPVPVVYVPGNHEYDNLDFDETHERLRALCEELDILWLERETRGHRRHPLRRHHALGRLRRAGRTHRRPRRRAQEARQGDARSRFLP